MTATQDITTVPQNKQVKFIVKDDRVPTVQRRQIADTATALYAMAMNDDVRFGIEALAVACGLELKRG